jgi:hypothetical protein
MMRMFITFVTIRNKVKRYKFPYKLLLCFLSIYRCLFFPLYLSESIEKSNKSKMKPT